MGAIGRIQSFDFSNKSLLSDVDALPGFAKEVARLKNIVQSERSMPYGKAGNTMVALLKNVEQR